MMGGVTRHMLPHLPGVPYHNTQNVFPIYWQEPPVTGRWLFIVSTIKKT